MTNENEHIPADFPVQPLQPGDNPPGKATCGVCGRSWDDDKATAWTPAPAGRCPFEHFHGEGDDIPARLEYLRGEIEAERISMDEILELQSLAEHIAPGDVLLLEWAGVPESVEDETDKATARPWEHVRAGDNHWIKAGGRAIAFIGGKDSIFTATPGTPHAANADLIARAVNSHDGLVAVCEKIRDALCNGETVTIEPGSVRAAEIAAALAKAAD